MSPSRRRVMSLVLFFSLLAGTVLQSRAGPLSGELRCQCIQLHSGRLAMKNIARINLYPSGPHCVNSEVIATTKDGREICLNPETPWVQVVVRKILEKNEDKHHHQGSN